MWCWDEIAERWHGRNVQADPADIVAAFNIVEDVLGREWIQGQTAEPPILPGAACAGILSIGLALARLRDTPGINDLMARMRANDVAAIVELTAAYMCAGEGPNVLVEFGVPVRVGNHTRVPDFRVRQPGEPWVWVEVTNPDESDEAKELRPLLEDLGQLVLELPRGEGAEIFIRRDPTQDEVNALKTAFRVRMAGGFRLAAEVDLGHAVIVTGHFVPGSYAWDAFPESLVPRVQAVFDCGEGEEKSELLLRHAFTDSRARRLLGDKAKQLPNHEPSILMVGYPEGLTDDAPWIGMIERALQPTQHTRVSAVGFFTSKRMRTDEGAITLQYVMRLIENRHARNPLPAWLLDRLRKLHP